MFFVLFAFWLLLNGRWTVEIGLTGLVLSGLIYLFIWRFMGYSPRREWALAKRLPGLVVCLFFLLGEILRSALATIRLIWSPRRVAQPRLTSFRTPLETRKGKVLLANSITLTPGTITVDVREDRFLVHCLDNAFEEGLSDSAMQRRIRRLEKGGRPHA
ncbi:MAG: Na+/H+ antiporter subunit E [Clostridia bacterium]|nr:Na+/H+ antiporter subunit E [Clostridia bacterium]